MDMESTDSKKLPGSIGVLTVLTFIGSAIGLFFACLTYIKADKNPAEMEAARDNPNSPEFVKKMMTPEAIEQARVMAANKLLLLIFSLIGLALCTYGAMQMRKLKKEGYMYWLIGEVFPFIGTAVLVGVGSFTGLPFYIIVGITVLFVILYTSQLKYLKK